jgi:type IX secretion system PorP/SprF family membrane protein
MKQIIQVLVTVVLEAMFSITYAQQDPQFTQYFDNTLFVNPAYAGSNDVLNFTALHRQQWVGFDGRPVSSSFSLHSPLSYESVGVGLTFVNDQLGPLKQNMVYGDFSYTLKFKNPKNKLSFGLKAGMNVISMGTSSLVTTEANDPKLISNVVNHINPNLGAGIYYHTPKFFIGASSPKVLERSYDGLDNRNLEQRHYFGIIGGVIKLNTTWKLRPTAQVKLTNNAPMSIDMSLAGVYMDKFWIGGMYRLNAAFGAFIQYQLTDQLKAGFASDFGTQTIKNYNNGSFEIMLSYDFRFKKEGVRSGSVASAKIKHKVLN